MQKQIIAATWKVIRRETTAAASAAFAPDVKLVGESQTSAREQAAALGERLQDPKSQGHLINVLKHMDAATQQLADAAAGAVPAGLRPALASEQAAYQALLKLRAREVEVTRGQRASRGTAVRVEPRAAGSRSD